jgi:hypothetical protein
MQVDTNVAAATRAGRRLAAGSVVLMLAGVVGYFAVVFTSRGHLAWVRNDALPNWVLVVIGLVLASRAVRRDRRSRLSKIVLGIDVVLAAGFAALLYVEPVVPPATLPPLGRPAPDFKLYDQSGKAVALADFRGSPLLLVFYRGHW